MKQNRAPIIADVDIVIIGGTTGAVAAAAAAAEAGACVFLAAAETYLGEDLCATGRLWSASASIDLDSVTPAMVRQLFVSNPIRPMHVKKTLDDVLLQAGVQFLFECQPMDVLRDEHGQLSGILFGTRSGLLAIRAKSIIDASPHASAARSAGVKMQHHPGTTQFHQVVLSTSSDSADSCPAADVPDSITVQEKGSDPLVLHVHQFQFSAELPAYTPQAMAETVQSICDRNWAPDHAWRSERLFYVPQENIISRAQTVTAWPGAADLDLDVLRPAEDGLYVLSMYADLSRNIAAELMAAVEYMRLGDRLGRQLATEVSTRRLGNLSGTTVATQDAVHAPFVYETLRTTRFDAKPMLDVGQHQLPVIDEYDVVVVGGGTGGAPAAIAAARNGARTLVLERLAGLGGVGTLGMISIYYHGYLEGFTAEIDAGVAALGAAEAPDIRRWNPEHKQEWFRRELRKAKADIWFHAIVTGAVVDSGRVCGVTVATPYGCGIIRAGTVLDCTGNADVAAAAGAACITTGPDHIAVQGSGLGNRPPVPTYANTDWTFIDDSDPIDTWRAFVTARRKFYEKWDLQQLLDTRERRQIIGAYSLTPIDAYTGRTFPDSICLSRSNFDTHGMTVHPIFLMEPPDRESLDVYVPLRCLLPRDITGIAVTGLAISAHRDVMPVLRMQADIQNHSYAIGLAAVTAARSNGCFQAVDLPALQRQLHESGILPREALAHNDNFPLAAKEFTAAISDKLKSHRDIAVFLSNPAAGIPLLYDAYKTETNHETLLHYAKCLAISGNQAGKETMLEYLRATAWDSGWNYKGMGQFGMSLSPLDRVIVCLGLARIEEALPLVVEKIQFLQRDHELSHHRAVALYCEQLQNVNAALPLAELLQKPGMTGYAWTKIADELADIPESPVDNSTRNNSLRELILARALYRCGDWHAIGKKILQQYACDIRGHYARHATGVLQ